MSEHTPGPWSATGDTGDERVCATRDGKCICCVALMGDSVDGEVTPETRAEWAANARLIARAPDMAAEIERLRARVAELEKDAARYRWLRATGCAPDEVSARARIYDDSINDLDAAIDAALAQQEGEG